MLFGCWCKKLHRTRKCIGVVFVKLNFQFCVYRRLMVKSTQVACWLVQWGLDIRKTYLIKRPVSQRHYTYFCAKKQPRMKHTQISKNCPIPHVLKTYLLSYLLYDSGVVHVHTGLELHLQLLLVNPRTFLTDKVLLFAAVLFKPFAWAGAHQAATLLNGVGDVELGLIPVCILNNLIVWPPCKPPSV